ncbi:MAG: hypothetical protein WBA97_38415 [Actinophytocola sp.]|uniref:hypothetical protein n=1 Tax=Actinophytocola sp. TaxID=1872138 RepID=UPI003C789035
MPDTKQTEGSQTTNTATDNANVGAQIGNVEGDAVFHKHETIYQVAEDASAEKKFRVARSFIDGGIPRQAEDLIRQAISAGYVTTEVSYYYALSVLSERSLNRLGADELDKLQHATRVAEHLPHDQWWAAIVVIGGLVQCAVHPASAPSKDALRVVLDAFQALGKERQAEITRHLDMIFDGAMQEELDRLNAATIPAQRAKGERSERAWKYFHPDPTAPRRATPTPLRNGEPRTTAWLVTTTGIAGLGLFVALGVRTAGVGFLILFLVGVLITGRFGAQVLTPYLRRRMKEAEHGRNPAEFDEYEELGVELNPTQKFAHTVWKRIHFYFAVRRPVTNKYEWNMKTKGFQAALHWRLVRLYSNRRVAVPTLNWLIRWHAKQIAEQWRDESLPDFRRTLRPRASTILSLTGSAVVAASVAGLLVSSSTAQGFGPTVTSILQVVAACFAGAGIAYLFADRRAMTQEQEALDEFFADEQREYLRWQERLRDRPTDLEMANWLESDKHYLKTLAMRRCELSSREIIAHVVLTAGKPRAMRARVVNGPPRFSRYVVLVFLLTQHGVREVDVDLNFLTGAIYDERRTAFKYDALASARVLEKGFHSAEGQQHVVLLGRDVHLTEKSALVISRTFELALVNDQKIEVVVDNYEGLIDDSATEDRNKLDELALDSSGVAIALHILEAVAAEGREWITREQDRRDRRWREWERGGRDSTALGGRPWPPRIGPAVNSSEKGNMP